MTFRKSIKSILFRILGKDPEAVVVTFLSGKPSRAAAMAAEVRRLIPDRRHLTIAVGTEALSLADIVLERGSTWRLYGQLRRRLRHYRVGIAPVLFDGTPNFRPLRLAAMLFAPRRILAYNARLERHHLRLRNWIASLLFLRGVPLDRIFLRPYWLFPWKRDRSSAPSLSHEFEGRPLSKTRPRIAILTPYLPWPLSHGGAVRMFNLLREAAREYDIFLFAFHDLQRLEDLSPLCELCCKVTVVQQPRYREPRWSSLHPPEVNEFNSPEMRRKWEKICRDFAIPLRQVEYTALASYDGDILVEHDVTFDLYTQIHEKERSLRSWWDLWRWKRFESEAVRKFRRVVVMSTKDAGLLATGNTVVIPNGVDLDRFQPQPETPGRNLLFVGSFRHFPNILAFRFFTEQILPSLAERFPDLQFTVVAGPDPLLYWREHTGGLTLPELSNLRLLGFVPDVRPLYAEANVVVVPTTVSAGTNLKVLEAMAMGRAIVSTSSGCAGLGLEHGKSVWIADTAQAFIDGVAQLLEDEELRGTIANNGRRKAVAEYDWRALGRRQNDLYDELLNPGRVWLRAGTPADLESIVRIQKQSPESSQWAADRFLAYDCTVAVRNGEVAGFLVSRQTAPGEREILNLAVAPEHRRKGVARALMQRELGEHSGDFFLEVRESNMSAQNLYRSLGFCEVGRRPGYYDHPREAAVVMRLQK